MDEANRRLVLGWLEKLTSGKITLDVTNAPRNHGNR
jgi:hypothetical protein